MLYTDLDVENTLIFWGMLHLPDKATYDEYNNEWMHRGTFYTSPLFNIMIHYCTILETISINMFSSICYGIF